MSIVPMAIKIGDHVERSFFGMTFNMDTIYSTLFAGAVVLALGFWARKQLIKETADHVPTKVQLVWEAVVTQVETQVADNLGKVNRWVVELSVALFFFILFANWLEIIPTELNDKTHLLPAPTSDTNLTYAMAVLVMGGVWTFGVRQRGLRGYLKHFLEPHWAMLPLNIIEEVTKPISLALRLFGNIFAGGILIALIGSLTAWTVGAVPVGGILSVPFGVLWKLFDMAIGGIQAFIFALLTVLYFGMAAAHDDHEDHEDEHDTSADKASAELEPAH
jgi:F-type H+-transporting ATPase subunit a